LNEAIKRLEEKIAFLERHITEQDKAMLELAEEMGRLRRDVKTLRDGTAARGAGSAGQLEGDDADERPPHY
jgi:SlyX protein